MTYDLVAGFVHWMQQQGYAVGSINVRLSTIKCSVELAHQAGARPRTHDRRPQVGYALVLVAPDAPFILGGQHAQACPHTPLLTAIPRQPRQGCCHGRGRRSLHDAAIIAPPRARWKHDRALLCPLDQHRCHQERIPQQKPLICS